MNLDFTFLFLFLGSILKQRDVRHFGYEFDYSSNLVHKISSLNHSIPPELNDICERILKNKIMKEMPDQITVNRYIPGQGKSTFFIRLNVIY